MLTYQQQFEGCSNAEIRACILYRTRNIRQIRDFLKDENTFKYGSVRASIHFALLRHKSEIKYLWKIRNKERRNR